MVTLADRRQFHRNEIDWPVSVYVPRLAMFVNGRSVDVSQSGAKVSLPLAVPIRAGQVLELNFPRTTTLAKMAGCYSRIKTALVVRVEGDASPAKPAEPFYIGAGQHVGGVAPALMAAPAKASRSKRQVIAVHFDKKALSVIQ
jgi:hypothetical protein